LMYYRGGKRAAQLKAVRWPGGKLLN
jgi:hypothetical protein